MRGAAAMVAARPCLLALRRLSQGPRKPFGPGPTLRDLTEAYPGGACWSCKQVFNPRNTTQCDECSKLVPGESKDYFALLGLPVSLHVERETLERAFQAVQRRVHPDRHVRAAEAEQALAGAQSAAASEAYQTIKHPLSRAKYVLAMKGVDLETSRIEDPALLLQVMEQRELLEAMADVEEARAALVRYERSRDHTLHEAEQLRRHHGDKALVPMTHLIVSAHYYDKLAEVAQERVEQLTATRT